MGQLLSAFPYLMRLKYSFQTEEGKKGLKIRKRPQLPSQEARFSSLTTSHNCSSPKIRKEESCFKLGTGTFTKDFFSMTPCELQDRIRKLEALFQEEKRLTNNPRRLKKPKSTCHRTLEGLGFWNLVENGPPLLSSDSKIAYWALINYCRLEQQDLSEARTES